MKAYIVKMVLVSLALTLGVILSAGPAIAGEKQSPNLQAAEMVLAKAKVCPKGYKPQGDWCVGFKQPRPCPKGCGRDPLTLNCTGGAKCKRVKGCPGANCSAAKDIPVCRCRVKPR